MFGRFSASGQRTILLITFKKGKKEACERTHASSYVFLVGINAGA